MNLSKRIPELSEKLNYRWIYDGETMPVSMTFTATDYTSNIWLTKSGYTAQLDTFYIDSIVIRDDAAIVTNTLNSLSGYRYAFNGQEKDDEIAGEGNSYTAEFWEYDSRLARRWNVDPSPMDGVSLYECFGDDALIYSDPNGDILKYSGTLGFKIRAHIHLAILSILSPSTRDRIKELKNSNNVHTIQKREEIGKGSKVVATGMKINSSNGIGTGSTIYLDLTGKFRDVVRKINGGGGFYLFRSTAHELEHAFEIDEGTMSTKIHSSGNKQSEVDAVHQENIVITEIYLRLHLNTDHIPFRKTYGGVNVFNSNYDYVERTKEDLMRRKAAKVYDPDYCPPTPEEIEN